MDAYLQRAQELPGRGLFRTGISLRAPSIRLSESSRSGSSEDTFIFLVSFPYFGGSSGKLKLGPESESIKLVDFKSLGVSGPGWRATVGTDNNDDTTEVPVEQGEMLVHQARYMISDNCKLYFLVYF